MSVGTKCFARKSSKWARAEREDEEPGGSEENFEKAEEIEFEGT